jgi:hypothetical protein
VRDQAKKLRLREMSGDFQVGQKVVCVDDGDADDTGASTGIRYLRRGRSYTVSRTASPQAPA